MSGGAAGGASGGSIAGGTSGGSIAGGMSGGAAGGTSGGTSDAGIRGLDFPSNQGTGQPASGPGTYLRFVNPQLDGLPIWGPSGQGVTLVWRYFPRQQTGYYTTFFWANDGNFLWRGGSPDTYYGAHPYPTTSSNTGTSHHWEISVGGGDVVTTRSGGPKLVVKGRWYTQALRVIRNPNGTKTLIFYLDLPSTAPGDVIESTESASYGEVVPPMPALVFGNAPWRSAFQDERLSGVLRHVKIFNVALSEADTLAEAAASTLVTSQGQARIWYGKINPTPTDLTCDFGTGRAPQWADSGRAGLFTQ
jgi:hypothetical protein